MNFIFKLFFFVQYLSVGIMGPYFALYLYQEDFSGIQVGLLLGSMPIAAVLLQPLGGYLSDVLQSRRSIFNYKLDEHVYFNHWNRAEQYL